MDLPSGLAMKAHETHGSVSMTGKELDQRESSAPELARTRPRLAIVLPCFNEELVIAETVGKLLGVLRDLREKGQVASESFLFFCR